MRYYIQVMSCSLPHTVGTQPVNCIYRQCQVQASHGEGFLRSDSTSLGEIIGSGECLSVFSVPLSLGIGYIRMRW